MDSVLGWLKIYITKYFCYSNLSNGPNKACLTSTSSFPKVRLCHQHRFPSHVMTTISLSLACFLKQKSQLLVITSMTLNIQRSNFTPSSHDFLDLLLLQVLSTFRGQHFFMLLSLSIYIIRPYQYHFIFSILHLMTLIANFSHKKFMRSASLSYVHADIAHRVKAY